MTGPQGERMYDGDDERTFDEGMVAAVWDEDLRARHMPPSLLPSAPKRGAIWTAHGRYYEYRNGRWHLLFARGERTNILPEGFEVVYDSEGRPHYHRLSDGAEFVLRPAGEEEPFEDRVLGALDEIDRSVNNTWTYAHTGLVKHIHQAAAELDTALWRRRCLTLSLLFLGWVGIEHPEVYGTLFSAIQDALAWGLDKIKGV